MKSVERITPPATIRAATATSLVVEEGLVLLYWNHVKKQIVETAAWRLGKQLKDVSLAHILYT
jgi:hypothetical protein